MIDKEGKPIIRQNSFYILAPVEMFRTMKHVPKNFDPILLFKIDSEKGSHEDKAKLDDQFMTVHYWGNDFTFLRKYRYFINSYCDNSDTISNRSKSYLIGITFIIAYLLNIYGPEHVSLISIYLFTIGFIGYSLSINLAKKKYLNDLWNTNKT